MTNQDKEKVKNKFRVTQAGKLFRVEKLCASSFLWIKTADWIPLDDAGGQYVGFDGDPIYKAYKMFKNAKTAMNLFITYEIQRWCEQNEGWGPVNV